MISQSCARLGVAFGPQPGQAKRPCVVGVAGHHAIAVGDQRSLTPGVVGDVLDVGRAVQLNSFQGPARGCSGAAALAR